MLTTPTSVPQIKDLSSIISCEPVRSFKKLLSQNLTHWGKGYFAAFSTYGQNFDLELGRDNGKNSMSAAPMSR